MAAKKFVELSDVSYSEGYTETVHNYLSKIAKAYSKYPHKCVTICAFGMNPTLLSNQCIVSPEDKRLIFQSIEDVCNTLMESGLKDVIPGANIKSIIMDLNDNSTALHGNKKVKTLYDYITKATYLLYEGGKLQQMKFVFENPLHTEIFSGESIFYRPINRTNAIPLSKI